jgi:hypothetical protein
MMPSLDLMNRHGGCSLLTTQLQIGVARARVKENPTASGRSDFRRGAWEGGGGGARGFHLWGKKMGAVNV